jgi:hypothetical protein
MALLRRLRGWWNKDALELADEETRMTEAERDVAEEDYEAHKDDARLRGGWIYGGGTDYQGDSKPPRRY